MNYPLFSLLVSAALISASSAFASPPPGVTPPQVEILQPASPYVAEGLIFIGAAAG
jgi:hypothetical protein